MANDFLSNLLGSFESDNVGDSVEKTITDAIGAKVKTSVSSAGKNRVNTASLGSKNKVKTSLASSSSEKRSVEKFNKKDTSSFMSGVGNVFGTIMEGTDDSDNVGETIEDNIMSALTGKLKGKKEESPDKEN